MHYILDENDNPRCEPELKKWARWFDEADRQVAKEKIGEAVISTVFLGIDYNHEREGPPVLWETMIFGGPLDEETWRCTGGWADAQAMHKRMCDRVRETL